MLTTPNQQNVFPVAALLVGAAIWGLLWYPYRLLEQDGISGQVATVITYAVALALGLVLFRKSIRVSQIFSGDPQLLFWIAMFAGWTNMAYILGVIHGEVMRVLLLFYLAPLWTILFARLLLNEKLSLHGYLLIALSLAGAATMLWQPESDFPLPSSHSDWMGLSGGIMFALMNVMIRKDQHHSIQLKSLALWLGVLLVGLGHSLLLPAPLALSDIAAGSWLLMLAIGLVVFALSLTMQYGLTHIPANRASVIMLFELVVAAIAAYFLANEAMTLKEWAGGAMIVSASLFSARMNRG
ncbi:MAG: DMT family transporter [Nitrosospira sp.]|nr:DMT family transporter [Nitrosospira sp.]